MNPAAEFSLSDSVQIELDVEKLAYLFSTGVLCAADLRCLNRASKKRVWALCLESCINHCVKRTECPRITKRSISFFPMQS